MLPDYIHMRVAESILFAGKAIRVLRNPSNAFWCQGAGNQSHSHMPRLPLNIKGNTRNFPLQKEPFVATKLTGEELLLQSEADKIEAMLLDLKVYTIILIRLPLEHALA